MGKHHTRWCSGTWN